MEYVEVVGAVLGLMITYSFKRQYDMEKKVHDHETRLKVEEAKGEARDGDSKEIKDLLKTIVGDLSAIKQEQGYWRGRQESQN